MHRIRNTAALFGATTTILLVGCDVQTGSQTGSQTSAEQAGNQAETPVATEAELKTSPISPNVNDDVRVVDMPEKGLESMPANWIVQPEPRELDLGTFSTKDTARGTVKLVNTGDTPMTVQRARTTCGCTTAGLQPNTVIEPGESAEVEISLTGTAEGTRTKKVTFEIVDHPKVWVDVTGTSVMYVKYEPANVINPRDLEDGRIVLRSIDEQPFRILSASADIFKELPAEPAVEHEVFIDYEKAEEHARLLKRLIFHIDHPKCDQVPTRLNLRMLYTPDPSLAGGEPIDIRDADGTRTKVAPSVVNRAPAWNAPRVVSELKAKNNAAVIEAINSGELDIEARNRDESTLLDIAAQNGALDVMQVLLDNGANIEAADRANRTPLMNAARSGQNEAVRMLLDAGAQLEARDTIMNTALSWAAFQGSAETVKILIDAGAEINIVGAATGWTPVMWASGFGDPASVALLVEAGADLTTQDFLEGATALHHAARTGENAHVQALLAAGADVGILDRNGKTPLHMACENSGGTVDKVKTLVEAGADVNTRDNRGLTPLEHARNRTDGNAPAIVEYLESLPGGE